MRAIPPFVLIIFIAFGAVGFVGVTVWIENTKLEQLRADVDDQKSSRTETQKTLADQGEKILIREVSIRSLSQDLVDQRELIKNLEQQVNVVREAVDKKSNGSDPNQSKTEEILKALTNQLQGATQRLREMEIMEGQHTVRINTIQQRLTGVDGQIILMREQFLMKPQPQQQEEEIIRPAIPASLSPSASALPAPQRSPWAG